MVLNTYSLKGVFDRENLLFCILIIIIFFVVFNFPHKNKIAYLGSLKVHTDCQKQKRDKHSSLFRLILCVFSKHNWTRTKFLMN